MDEVVELLSDILSELRDMNEKIDELIEYHSGDCERNDVLEELKGISYNTQNNNVISDIYNVVTEIQVDTTYNDKIEMVPSNIVAGIFGFKTRTMFEVDAAERENVKVKF